MGLNGSVGTMGIQPIFQKRFITNIAYCVYRQPKTINEIADCLGVSPVLLKAKQNFGGIRVFN